MADDPKNTGKDRGVHESPHARTTLRAPPVDQIATDPPGEKVIIEDLEETPATERVTPVLPDPNEHEKKALQRRASSTNLKAEEILEALKKSSRPPKP